MPKSVGNCPKCGKTHYSDRSCDLVVCDCWLYCPLCGSEMAAYVPDLTVNVYGLDGSRDLQTVRVCPFHSSPFFSKQKLVEVETA
ncbi:MAG: hypothetical protein QXJ02_04260 [Candidatus Bathyarchaeia archaeon]